MNNEPNRNGLMIIGLNNELVGIDLDWVNPVVNNFVRRLESVSRIMHHIYRVAVYPFRIVSLISKVILEF